MRVLFKVIFSCSVYLVDGLGKHGHFFLKQGQAPVAEAIPSEAAVAVAAPSEAGGISI